MQYRRTPTSSGFSPNEMLNGRQMRTKIDTLLPSPAHITQEKQVKEAARSIRNETVARVTRSFKVGDACYALYCGPRRNKDPRWVPAVIVKQFGSRSFNVKVLPKCPVWRRHLEQLQPRHTSELDSEPGDWPGEFSIVTEHPMELEDALGAKEKRSSYPKLRKGAWLTIPGEYGPHNPRRSKRKPKPRKMLDL